VKFATVQSPCECQARLNAELDENKQVVRSWAVERRRGTTEVAPAHTIRGDLDRFQIGWSCPYCIRNVTRSFDTGGIAWLERAS
jgi:hypothetical protein